MPSLAHNYFEFDRLLSVRDHPYIFWTSLDLFGPTYPLCQHSTEHQQKRPFLNPPSQYAEVIYGWSLKDHSSITSAKRWVGGWGQKMAILLIYSTIYGGVGGWAYKSQKHADVILEWYLT